jgi:hypothetical protein
MSNKPPSPWKEFLEELDALLDEPIELHCIGGFAVVAGYGLQRGTNDLDYRTLVPYNRVNELQQLAGEGSALAKKHKVYIQYTGVDSMPESYADRLTELYPKYFKNIRLFIPDPYDLALSKLTRNSPPDRQDVEYLAKTQHLDPAVLKKRYEEELRPIIIGEPSWHDGTLKLWLDAYFTTKT